MDAKIEKIKRWSPVWIVPIVTALIGAWILFYHFSHLGPQVVLTATTAEGIEAGKTRIKSRSVDIGVVEEVTLSDDLTQVIIKARLNDDMEKLLRQDSAFWIVKPRVGADGVSGLGTLMSGVYIELLPGQNGAAPGNYLLLNAPPQAPPDAKGLRIQLTSIKAGQLNPGDPVLFRGFRVGSVETSGFDPKTRIMRYQLFIQSPYDSLVTQNVHFWKESGMSLNLSAQGMQVSMGSLATLFSGGVSFDVPDGWEYGSAAKNQSLFQLFESQQSIQDSLYAEHHDYLLFFSDSVRGLQAGAPVEFRGIRLGTVAQVPFYSFKMTRGLSQDYRVPVLIRIEPGRLQGEIAADLETKLKDASNHGLRATTKAANLLTGALYIDLEFYPNEKPSQVPRELYGYPVIPTVSGGMAQVQQKVMQTLDKINALPLNPMVTEATNTLAESRRTMQEFQVTLAEVNKLVGSPAMQNLPKDMQQTLQSLNQSLKGLQPGSPAYNKIMNNMQHLDQVLRELQPVLRTINSKSNALVFSAPGQEDPQPKKGTP